MASMERKGSAVLEFLKAASLTSPSPWVKRARHYKEIPPFCLAHRSRARSHFARTCSRDASKDRRLVPGAINAFSLFFLLFFNPFAKGSWKWTINDGPQGENEYRLRTVVLPSFLQDKMTFLTLRDIPRVRLATLIDSLYVIEILFRRLLKSYTVKLIGSL